VLLSGVNRYTMVYNKEKLGEGTESKEEARQP